MKVRRPLVLLMHRFSFFAGLVALLGVVATNALPVQAQSPSFVRVIHASPYVGAADVFVDGSKLLSSFLFGAVTDYAAIPAGPHKVQIALVGKGASAAAITQTLNVQPGVAYTVAAIGTSPTNLALDVFIDNNLIAPGTAKLRAYNLAPDAGSLDVSARERTLCSGVTYKDASEYSSVSSGDYKFAITTTANKPLQLAETLNTNTVTSVFTIGLSNGTPKLEVVPAQVSGVPGLPGTGSDPDPSAATATNTQPILPWLLGALALIMLCASVVMRHVALGGKH